MGQIEGPRLHTIMFRGDSARRHNRGRTHGTGQGYGNLYVHRSLQLPDPLPLFIRDRLSRTARIIDCKYKGIEFMASRNRIEPDPGLIPVLR